MQSSSARRRRIKAHLSVIFLQRQIELAQPLRLSRDASAKHITFVGEQHALRFVAPLPGHLGAGGMYWFALSLADSSAGKRLVLAYWLFQREDWERFGAADAEQAVLMEGLKNLQLEYLEPATSDSPARWTSDWEPQDRLPRLIRVQITHVSDKRWPVARISSRTEAGGKCTRGVTLMTQVTPQITTRSAEGNSSAIAAAGNTVAWFWSACFG